MRRNKKTTFDIRKIYKFLKGFSPLLISFFALVISYFALNEARIANRLEIEPVVSIQCPDSFKRYELKIIFKNEGNVEVKDLIIAYVIKRSEPLEKDLEVFVLPPSYKIPGRLKVNEERSFPINLEGEIEFAKTEIDKMPDGQDLYVEIGHGIFLGVKVLYRRISDSKLFEKTSYFFLMPKTSEIIVGELKGWWAEPWLEIIKELEAHFPF